MRETTLSAYAYQDIPFAKLVQDLQPEEAGAAHVYAIEELDDAYARASDLIGRLGLAESVTLVHGNSMDLNLRSPSTSVYPNCSARSDHQRARL